MFNTDANDILFITKNMHLLWNKFIYLFIIYLVNFIRSYSMQVRSLPQALHMWQLKVTNNFKD